MLILGGKRVCGKTTELIKMSYTNQIPIIVLNTKRGEMIENLAKREGFKIPKTITYKEFAKGIDGIRINEILIDDVEDILQDIFKYAKITAITTSIPFMPLTITNDIRRR